MIQMWGIYAPNKEANMYPKPVQDLSGWDVRSIACNSKVMLYFYLFLFIGVYCIL